MTLSETESRDQQNLRYARAALLRLMGSLAVLDTDEAYLQQARDDFDTIEQVFCDFDCMISPVIQGERQESSNYKI